MQHDHRNRRSVRLKDYDYRQNGAYFITICTHERESLFGDVSGDGAMILNDFGRVVEEEWLQTAALRPNVELDTFVVMPNHVHGIVVIVGDSKTGVTINADDKRNVQVGARRALPLQPPPSDKPAFGKPLAQSLGIIVGGFKSAVSKRINAIRDTPGATVWQRNYYDKIIRNETMLNAIRQYIEANPANWAFDEENPLKRGQ